MIKDLFYTERLLTVSDIPKNYNAIRLMALSDYWKNEILKLKREYIGFDNQLFFFSTRKRKCSKKKFMRELTLKLNWQTEDELIFGENKRASKKSRT